MTRYVYQCDGGARGHGIGSSKPETKCLAYVHGEPCHGELRQVAGPKPKK